MKKYAYLILLLIGCGCAMAQPKPDLSDRTWKITLKTVDEQGVPLPAVKVGIGYFTNSESVTIDSVTDSNGLFSATRTVGPSIVGYLFGFSAEKEGYYDTRTSLFLDYHYDPIKWNPTVFLKLKKVGKPIAMYAKHLLQVKIPELNKEIGFDLMMGDWVKPYGKGIQTDLLLSQHHTNGASGYPIFLSFPNPGDGIQEFIVPDNEKGSGLRSSHEAPIDGYQPKVSQTEMTNPNRNFYFRVRTKLDENGNVVSARYGKIYGDLAQFTYYLNPTPNDRNIEFDPKQNLFHGRDDSFKVSIP